MSEEQTPGNELVTQTDRVPQLRPARLAYHPAIEDRFGIDRGTWKYLTDVQFPNAEEPESIITALSYCRARKLDIMKKPVNIVSVWDKKRSRMVDSVWPAISESRITAMRTGEYAGKDATEFGPEITETLGGVEVTYPEWAMVTVYRFIKGQRCAFSGERVRWKEYYATAKRDTKAPNDMWGRKSYSQASKCAEASALRSAFPEELGASATDVEMEGQSVEGVILERLAPGLLARLTGKQEGDGFDAASVEEQTKSRRKRKPKDEETPAADPTPEPEEAMHAEAQGAEVEETQVIEVAPHAPPGATYTLKGDAYNRDKRRPTYKDGKLLSTVHKDNEGKFTEYEKHAPEQPTQPEEEVVQVGHAEPGEVYYHTDFPATEDGRRVMWMDGQRCDTSALPDGEGISTYAEHAPEVIDDGDLALDPEAGGPHDGRPTETGDAPAAEPEPATSETATPASDDGALEEADSGPSAPADDDLSDLPEDFRAFIETVQGAKEYREVPAAMKFFYNTETFLNMDDTARNKVRADTWAECVERAGRGEMTGLPDHAQDLGAFRLWLETIRDKEAIDGTLRVLQRCEQWGKVSEGSHETILKAVSERKKVI